MWTTAEGAETDKGSEIAETTASLLGRRVRLIVRRQPKAAGDHLAFDDLDGWRLHSIITNVAPSRMSAAEVEARSRSKHRPVATTPWLYRRSSAGPAANADAAHPRQREQHEQQEQEALGGAEELLMAHGEHA